MINIKNSVTCFGSKCVHTLGVTGLCFHIWPDDGSLELKHVAEFLILITMYNVVLLTGINYYTMRVW